MSAKTIIGANRRECRPGGFTPTKRNRKRSSYRDALEVKKAAIVLLKDRGLFREMDAFGGGRFGRADT